MAPRRGARQQSIPDSGHGGLPSGPGEQENTTIPESQVAHTLPVRSTENPVTAQDMMPTLQPPQEGQEHSVTVGEPTSRTSGSEDDSDPELLLARRQLKELRRQRKKAEIQALIEREKCLIAQAQKDAVIATSTLTESNQGPVVLPQPLQDAVSATPTRSIRAHEVQVLTPTGSSEVLTGEPRGEKRPRADTIISTHDRPPPKADMEGKYRGKNMREFTTFMTRMEIHFRRYSYYFTTEERKVAEGAAWLSDALVLKWAQHEKERGEPISWQEFYEFLLYLINDPVNLLREAYQKYSDAKQTPEQSVRDFATYLAQWEAQLPEPYTERQRKEYLRTRVLPEVRKEVLKYKEEPDSYEGFVAHLQTVEDSLPHRRATIRAGQSRKPSHYQTQGESNKRQFRNPNPHRSQYKPSILCTYCNRYGHAENDCYKKRRHADKGKDVKSKNSEPQ
jgi:hypothetical protein